MHRIYRLLYCLILLVGFDSISFAQDQQGFFNDGFVGGVLGEEGTNVPLAGKKPPEIKREVVKPTPIDKEDSAQDDFFGNPVVSKSDVAPEKNSKDEIIPEDIDGSIQVNGITLLIESKFADKLSQAIKAFGRIVRTRNINPVRVYVVTNGVPTEENLARAATELGASLGFGDARPPTQAEADKMTEAEVNQMINSARTNPMFMKALTAAMVLTNVYHAPKEYPVQSLPSWVLHTDTGLIMLEGILDPSSMLTKSGRFVAPQGIEG